MAVKKKAKGARERPAQSEIRLGQLIKVKVFAVPIHRNRVSVDWDRRDGGAGIGRVDKILKMLIIKAN